MAINHANCTHPRTPAGRRACRDNRIASSSPVKAIYEDRELITPPGVRRARVEALQAKLERAADGEDHRVPNRRRQRASGAVRIQPRRGGARVAARASGCVQAALHIDAHGGACACGWVAA
jgi:hypothetical protein